MRTLKLILAGVLLSSSVAHAQPHWKEMIGRDQVKIAGGKMVSEGYKLCKMANKSFQLRSYAEAPESAGLSRDFFIQFATMMELIPTLALAKASGDVDLNCKPITSPIGKVDLELNVYMTGEGFQVEMVQTTSQKTTRHASRWADIFEQD